MKPSPRCSGRRLTEVTHATNESRHEPVVKRVAVGHEREVGAVRHLAENGHLDSGHGISCCSIARDVRGGTYQNNETHLSREVGKVLSEVDLALVLRQVWSAPSPASPRDAKEDLRDQEQGPSLPGGIRVRR